MKQLYVYKIHVEYFWLLMKEAKNIEYMEKKDIPVSMNWKIQQRCKFFLVWSKDKHNPNQNPHKLFHRCKEIF